MVEMKSHDDIDINALRSIEDIQRAYDALTLDEERVGAELDAILDEQQASGGLDVRLRAVAALTPHLGEIRADADQLSSLITHTATLAEKVSAKVRQLDLAKSRVAECQQRVHDLIDLKRCSEGVTTALQEENYEEAAAHIHRFLAMDEAVLRSTGQDLETGSGRKNTSLDLSLATLHQAENKVRGIVTRRFDEAVVDEDLASIERFFKIFPLINMHEEGLRKFTHYLRGKLSTASKDNLKQALDTPPGDKRASVIFADTLTLLFEGVARIVEIHQPLIETYYGPGRIFTVLSLLQEECDIQSVKIFKEFNRQRGISDKVRRVEESNSNIGKRGEEASKLQARDLDSLLGEMTLVQARVEMYWRFVRKRCLADMEVAQVGGASGQERRAVLDSMIAASQLNRATEDSLGKYILLERYFMAENIAKAVELDSMEADQLTTSMLDDVFFIIKKCVKRAIGSNNPDGICAVINNACTLLESDFYRVFQNQIKLGFPSTYLDQAYTVIQSSLQQGKLGGASDTERQKQLFLAYLNNAESGAQYIGKLQTSIESDLAPLLNPSSSSSGALSSRQSAGKIASCLAGLPAIAEQLRSVLEAGMAALRTALVRPRLKPWIDGFVSVAHVIASDEQLADYAANDPFVQALIVNIDGLVGGFRAALTPANHEAFVMLVAGEATLQLEKVVMKSSFNRLGGLQFDKEVRALCSYLTSLTTWTIRDKFARLIQMANLLNLETLQEVNEFCSSQSSGSLRLSATEVRQVLQLRIDFKPEEIKRIKFTLASS